MDRHPFANYQEVSDYLRLEGKDTLYSGECGTAHLKKIKQGRRVFWYWPQIELHRNTMIKKGECGGECLKALERIEDLEPARALALVK